MYLLAPVKDSGFFWYFSIEEQGFWCSIKYCLCRVWFTCSSSSWKEYVNWLNIVCSIFFGPWNLENCFFFFKFYLSWSLTYNLELQFLFDFIFSSSWSLVPHWSSAKSPNGSNSIQLLFTTVWMPDSRGFFLIQRWAL